MASSKISTYLVQCICDYHSVHWFKLSRYRCLCDYHSVQWFKLSHVQVPPCYLSLSLFLPSFSVTASSLSHSPFLFFPLDFVHFFKVTFVFLFVSHLSLVSLLLYSYAITLLPQQNFNIYYPGLLFTYCVWCCVWCNRRRGS